MSSHNLYIFHNLYFQVAQNMTTKAFKLNQESAFSFVILQYLFNASEFLIRPYLLCLTGFGRPFLLVTPELQYPWKHRLYKIFIVPLFCLSLAICFIPMCIGFCLRNVLHNFRRPYCLVTKTPMLRGSLSNAKRTYTVATANLCLLPELMARYNNLHKTWQRAKHIGERIVIDQMHYTSMMETFQSCSKKVSLSQHSSHTNQNGKLDADQKCSNKEKLKQIRFEMNSSPPKLRFDIVSHFPYVDFLCLQETFDRDYSKHLIKEVQKIYPHIVHDVGCCGASKNLYGLNSGLMFASRYEILDVRFMPFSKKCGFCRITGKGLLMAKVISEVLHI